MPIKSKVEPIVLTSIASSAVTGSYQAINANGLPIPCNIIKISNASSEDVTVSYDGTHDHEYVRTDTDLLLNFETNLYPGRPFLLAKGTVVYVKGTAGTGNIYLSGYGQE